jgi:hypothetical protein
VAGVLGQPALPGDGVLVLSGPNSRYVYSQDPSLPSTGLASIKAGWPPPPISISHSAPRAKRDASGPAEARRSRRAPTVASTRGASLCRLGRSGTRHRASLLLTFQRLAKNGFSLVAENLHYLGHYAPSASVRHMHIVVKFRAVRSLNTPPPSDAAWWGGSRFSQKNLPRPHIKRQKALRCDSVAMRAVSSRCQLKSLRDERWPRPLSCRNCRGRTDFPG